MLRKKFSVIDLGFRAQGELARFGASPVATDSSHALSFPKAAATPDGAEESKEEVWPLHQAGGPLAWGSSSCLLPMCPLPSPQAAVIPTRYSGCGGTKKTPWSVSAPGQSSGNPDKPAWPRDSAQEGEVRCHQPNCSSCHRALGPE